MKAVGLPKTVPAPTGAIRLTGAGPYPDRIDTMTMNLRWSLTNVLQQLYTVAHYDADGFYTHDTSEWHDVAHAKDD